MYVVHSTLPGGPSLVGLILTEAQTLPKPYSDVVICFKMTTKLEI